MGQNQWYHFGVGAPPILVYSGDWDVQWGYGTFTHGHVAPWLPKGEGRTWPSFDRGRPGPSLTAVWQAAVALAARLDWHGPLHRGPSRPKGEKLLVGQLGLSLFVAGTRFGVGSQGYQKKIRPFLGVPYFETPPKWALPAWTYKRLITIFCSFGGL